MQQQPILGNPERWHILGIHWHASAEIHPERSSRSVGHASEEFPRIEPECLPDPNSVLDWLERFTQEFSHPYHVCVSSFPALYGCIGDRRHLIHNRAENATILHRGDSLICDFRLVHIEPEQGFPQKPKHRVHLKAIAVQGICQIVDAHRTSSGKG